MKGRGLVSVIMPAYNAEPFIDEAINSVLNQTYTDWELIIIDDGSIDATAKKVHFWLAKENRIRYLYQENGKQGKARNFGISNAKGGYLAFLDADDLWSPEKLEIQINEIQKNNVDLVFSDCYVFNNEDVDRVSDTMNVKSRMYSGEKALQLFLEGNRIPILTVLVKKHKVIEVGGFSEKSNIQNVEDYHLWLKLLISNSVFYSSNKVLAKYRVHNNSVTVKDKWGIYKIIDVFFDLLQLYPIHKELIKQKIKPKFKLIYKRNHFTKAELAILINKNTHYLSKSSVSYFYLFLNFLLPTKVTKKLLIFLLNE